MRYVKKNNTRYEEIKVSVVMGVYNTEENYLRPAIESILDQSHKNLEFIIINDCSSEWCTKILEEYKYRDDRIVLINNEVNKGITKTLNIGLNNCTGKYIARMDSDDISLPIRIERQIEYLENNPNIHVLATLASIYEEGEECYLNNKYHIDPNRISNRVAGLYRKFDQERIRIRLSFGNIEFTHPTVMFRKSFLDEHDIRYNESLPKAQDYELWTRVQEYRCMYVLQELLFIYRDNGNSSTNTGSNIQIECANSTKKVKLSQLTNALTEGEIQAYTFIDGIVISGNAEQNIKLLSKVVSANNKKNIYPRRIYKQELFFRVFRKCLYKNNKGLGGEILKDRMVLVDTIKLIPGMLCKYLLDLLYVQVKQKQCVNRVSYIIAGANQEV